MGVFVSDLVSALAVRIVPRLAARADTDCYGQIQGPIHKHPYDNIYYIYLFIYIITIPTILSFPYVYIILAHTSDIIIQCI